MKRVRRNARVSYYEPEEPSFDEYIFCASCGDYVYEYCSIHGPLLVIPDDEVPTPTGFPPLVPRAALTIPRAFLHLAPSTIPDAGIGVFSSRTLPSGVRFGPFRGLKTDEATSAYCWQIYDWSNKPSHVIDARDSSKSNWMRYVNCSRHASEQNLVAYQYCGQLYYRTIRIIPRFRELLVFYGSECARELNIDLVRYHWPVYTETLVKYDTANEERERKSCSSKEWLIRDTSKVDMKENAFQNSETPEIRLESIDVNETEHSSSKSIVNLMNSEEQVVLNEYENKAQRDIFVCDDCGKTFNVKVLLIAHIATHGIKDINKTTSTNVKVQKYACSICDAKFATKSDLINHDIKMHDCKINYKACTECDYKTKHSSHFREHMERHSGIRNYKCDICEYVALTNRRLRRHKKSHTNSIYDSKFATKSVYINHDVVMHDSKINYKACTECEYKTKNSSHFREHMERHSGIRKYKCDICDYVAVTKHNLRYHKRSHSNRKLYECQTCGNKFKSNSCLNKHMIKHNIETPYECQTCGKKFKRKSGLNKHVVIHNIEKPYKCQTCEKAFNYRDKLVKHTKLHE